MYTVESKFNYWEFSRDSPQVTIVNFFVVTTAKCFSFVYEDVASCLSSHCATCVSITSFVLRWREFKASDYLLRRLAIHPIHALLQVAMEMDACFADTRCNLMYYYNNNMIVETKQLCSSIALCPFQLPTTFENMLS